MKKISVNELYSWQDELPVKIPFGIWLILIAIACTLKAQGNTWDKTHELNTNVRLKKSTHTKMYPKSSIDSLGTLLRSCNGENEQLTRQLDRYDSINQRLQTQLDKEIRTDQFRVEFWDKSGKKLVASAKKAGKILLRFLVAAPYRKNDKDVSLYIVGFTPNLKPIETSSSSAFITAADGGEKSYDYMLHDNVSVYNDPKMLYFNFDLPRPFRHGGIYIFKIYTEHQLLGTTEARLN